MFIQEYFQQYKNIHIVGVSGAEGSAVAEFLTDNGILPITAHDFCSKDEFRKSFYTTHLSLKPQEKEKALDRLLNSPMKINFKSHYLEGIEKADLVFVSQVWFKYSQNMPILKNLKEKGIPFKTITNLYFELCPCRIISITGTNGKTTVSRIVNNIFRIWSKVDKKSNIYFAGNDRQNIQVLNKLKEMKKDDVLILETSSTQLLLNTKISPYIGIITNITPNHIDDHGSFRNYIEAKKNLVRYQKSKDFAVLNFDNNETKKIAKEFKNNSFLFSRKKRLKNGCFILDNKITVRKNNKNTTLLSISDIPIPGNHNIENVLAAASAAYIYGIDANVIKKGISEYPGMKHRIKLLYHINNTKYYDDTQATTPEATIAAIKLFKENIILIAGGDDKGMKYKKLAEEINNKVKLLILF